MTEPNYSDLIRRLEEAGFEVTASAFADAPTMVYGNLDHACKLLGFDNDQSCEVAQVGNSTALDVLKELVACKDLKEAIYQVTTTQQQAELHEEYARRQPLAWAAARALLAQAAPPATAMRDDDLWHIAGVVTSLNGGNLFNVSQRECVTAIRAAFMDPDAGRAFIAAQTAPAVPEGQEPTK